MGTFSYNSSGELTGTSVGNATASYTYDGAGNRTSESSTGTTPSSCVLCALGDGITATGNAAVSANGAIAAGSGEGTAAQLSGNAKVSGTEIFLAGGASTSGHASIGALAPAGSALPADALSALPAPSLSGLAQSISLSGQQTSTASPGVYSSISLSGGAGVSLSPGVYVLTGQLSASGNAKVSGAGVTLYLACPSYPAPCGPGSPGAGINLSGNASLDLGGASPVPSSSCSTSSGGGGILTSVVRLPAAAGGSSSSQGGSGAGGGPQVALYSDPGDASSLSASGNAVISVTGSVHGANLGLSETGNAALSVSDGTAVLSGVDVSGRASLTVGLGQGAGPATTSYTYNGADELSAVSSPTISACYTYSGNGLRASATTDGVTQSFTWDQPARLLLSDGTNDYIYGPAGTPIEQVPVGGTDAVFLHTDELGSVRLLTSEAGTAIGTESYTPYGSVAASSGTAASPFGYAGAYSDPTGLLYMVNRYYDPSTAQFTSVDPLLATTHSPYSYAGDDPVNLSDPTGLSVNLQGVADWAKDPANLYGSNDGYGNDCTDFVSRALHFGGGDPESEPPWLPEAEWGGPPAVRLVGENDHYWYKVGYDIFLTAQSNSWSVAHDLAVHLQLNGSRFLASGLHLGSSGCPNDGPYNIPSGVVPGDLIFADWHGSSFSGITHAGVIVSVGDGELQIAQHTNNGIDSLGYWQQEGDGTPSDTWVWIVQPNQG